MRSSASLLSRSRRPGILFQSFSTSPVCGSGYGRGKGRGDGTDDASQLGGYGGGVGRRAGFENETQGFGRGRREGGVSPLPPPPSVATPLPPLKNSFVPAKAEAENVPDSGQQASKVFLEADGQAAKIDSRFEDAVTEKPFKPFKPFVAIVKPPEAVGQQRLVPENVSSELLLQGADRGSIPNARPAVPWNEDLKLHRQRGGASMDTWETRPRVVSILGEQHRAGKQGAKTGVIGSHAEAKDSVVASTTKSFQELSASPRVANNLGRTERAHGTPNVESKRANVWGSLSQILAPPGRTTSQPTPPLQSKPTSPPQNEPTPPLQSKPTSPPQNQPTPPLQSQPMTILQDHPTPPPHAAVVLQTGGLKVPLQPETPPAQPQMQNVPDVVQPEKGPPVVTPNTQFQLSDESYVAMIRWHYNAGRFAEVDQVYEDMKADGVHVTVPTYNLLVEIYSKSGQFDKMDTVYKLMREALIKSKTSAVSLTMEQPPSVSMSSAPETEKRATRDEAPEELVHAEEATAIEFHLVEKASVPEPQISVEEATTGPGQLSPSTRDLHPQTAEPIESAPPSHTLIKEESKATGVSQGFAAPSTDTNKPEFIVPGGFFAQRVDESEGLHSFRGLLKQPPVGGLFEDSGRAGDLHPSILPNVPSAGAVAGRGRVGGLFEDSGRAGDFNPSMLPNLPSAVSVAGRGRGAPLPDASVRAVGRGRGAPQGSPGQPLVSPPASIGAKAGQKERLPHAELSREQARERAMALLAKLPERQGTPALVHAGHCWLSIQ
jgi:pentatricopeptide repeat protein